MAAVGAHRINAVVAGVGAITTLLLVHRVLLVLPDPNRVVHQNAGASPGLLGALLIVVGGGESMRAQVGHAPARPKRGPARARRGLAREIVRINA